jgi:hypothetical protein
MSEAAAIDPATGTASSGAGAADPPYAPSWLHGLVTWVDRLPWPYWVSLAAVWVAATLLWHAGAWSIGQVPVGNLDRASAFWGFLAPALLWSAAYVERVAAAAFDAFRPALAMPADEAARLRHALIVVPARPALVIAVLAAAMTAADIGFSGSASYVGVSPLLLLLVFVVQSLYVAVLFQLVYRLVRQMGLVRRTLASSVAIDIFRPGPLHAFATLTARPAVVLVLVTTSSILAVPPEAGLGGLVAWVPYVVVPPILATIAFVVPLTGVHRALADQKERLQDAAQVRLGAALADMAQEVEIRDLSRADAWNKTLANLQAEGAILAKLPTWPWSMGTLRGFASAILLPVTLLLAQQAVSRLF